LLEEVKVRVAERVVWEGSDGSGSWPGDDSNEQQWPEKGAYLASAEPHCF
jgi:hypothetical protein